MPTKPAINNAAPTIDVGIAETKSSACESTIAIIAIVIMIDAPTIMHNIFTIFKFFSVYSFNIPPYFKSSNINEPPTTLSNLGSSTQNLLEYDRYGYVGDTLICPQSTCPEPI